MTTLAADVKRSFGADNSAFADLPVIASDIIYEGAAVGESTTTGTFRPLVGADTFAGFAVRRADNSAGAASAIKVRLMTRGFVYLPVTGLDNVNDYDAAVYASDDNAFTLTSTTGYTQIGKVAAYEGTSGYGLVYFESSAIRSI